MSVSRTVIRGLITAAIAAGVPLFNSGNAKACANVYAATFQQLAECGLDEEAAAAQKAGSEVHGDPVKLAWAYRRRLDEILEQGGCGRRGGAGDASSAAASFSSSSSSPFVVADFTSQSGPFAQTNTWLAVNDNVMGGRSDASLREQVVDEVRVALFSGLLRVEGGGFASVRASLRGPLDADALGLDTVEIDASLPEDGLPRVYRVGLLCGGGARRANNPSFFAEFALTGQRLETYRLPLDSFLPSFRGQPLDPREFPLDRSNINAISLMIAKAAPTERNEMEGRAVRTGRFAIRVARVALVKST